MPVGPGSHPSGHSLVLGELCQQSDSMFLRGHYYEGNKYPQCDVCALCLYLKMTSV